MELTLKIFSGLFIFIDKYPILSCLISMFVLIKVKYPKWLSFEKESINLKDEFVTEIERKEGSYAKLKIGSNKELQEKYGVVDDHYYEDYTSLSGSNYFTTEEHILIDKNKLNEYE